MNATYETFHLRFQVIRRGAVLAFWDTGDLIYKANKYRKESIFNIKHYFDNTWAK